jgi:hypothetical protein
MADANRQAEEARVIDDARAFAVRRVESTVRHLRKVTAELRAEYRPLNGVDGVDDTEKTRRFRVLPRTPTEVEEPTDITAPQPPEQDRREPTAVDQHDSPTELIEALEQPAPTVQPEAAEPEEMAPLYPSDADDTEVLEEIATVLQQISTLSETPLEQLADRPATEPLADLPLDESPSQPPAAAREVPIDDAVTAIYPEPLVESEWERKRLERLLKFVARQEPGLRWAIGDHADGTTLLVTDLAHGWIPPGITLPADVRLLEPDRRTGNAAALLSEATISMTYAPGDSLGWAADYDVTDTSSQPRELPPVDDLGWLLSDATHWRDGLPRMIHTLAKAGAGGTGIVDEEIDLLRVYLDTSRYQLLAQYPDVDTAQLLNCLLLAATEGVATGNLVSANYHFAWFQMLSAPPASRWIASP